MMARSILLACLWLAKGAWALERSGARPIAFRGGAEAEGGEGLFEENAADAAASEEAAATQRYAAAVEAAKAQGGHCDALDAFEAESLKPDRNESLLCVHWMDVKLQNLVAKKRAVDASNATAAAEGAGEGGEASAGFLGKVRGALFGAAAGGKGPFDEKAPYSRGVMLLATECGAYVEAERISEVQHAAYCDRCADALGVDGPSFAEAHKRFEVALGKEVFSASAKRVSVLRSALSDSTFASRAFASLTERESKILEHLKDEGSIDDVRKEMLQKLDEAKGNAYAEAALCKQLIPAVETMLGEPLFKAESA